MSGILQKGARRFTTQIGAAGVPDAVATTIPLVSTTGLPTDTQIEIVIDRTDGSGVLTPSKEEVVRGTVSGLNLINCIRGVEGTAQAHGAGATVNSFLTASMWNNFIDYVREVPARGLIGGVINVSVASNNLTVAVKTSQGTDPSPSNPVGIIIGNQLRSITSALSYTANAGSNWANAGSSELATREIDYFVYIGYNPTDNVFIGFSRIPYARSGADVSAAVANEKVLMSNWTTNKDANSLLVNIGRFAATLSAAASHNWSVPAFTNANLIQEPIYETRWLDWKPSYAASGSMTYTSVTEDIAKYMISTKSLSILLRVFGTTGGTASNAIDASLPFSYSNFMGGMLVSPRVFDGGSFGGTVSDRSTNQVRVGKSDSSNFALGTGRYIMVSGTIEIN